MEAAWQQETEPVPVHERFEPVPSVTKIKASMLKNDKARHVVSWESADLSRLSAKQVDAVHEIVSAMHLAEAHGGEVNGNLANRIPYRDISEAFTVQMLDESHHTWLLSRYLGQGLGRPLLKGPLIARAAIWHVARMRDPLICAMTASHFDETAAAEILREIVAGVDEPLLVEVFRTILRDEARHVALGRETVRFLLERPRYQKGWRRARAQMYRRFVESFSGVILGRYRKSAALFGIDVDRIRHNTLERVREAVPL